MGWIYKYKDDNILLEMTGNRKVTYLYLRQECSIDSLKESLEKAETSMTLEELK